MNEEARVLRVLVNKVGGEADCVAHVDEVWADSRPGATGTADR